MGLKTVQVRSTVLNVCAEEGVRVCSQDKYVLIVEDPTPPTKSPPGVSELAVVSGFAQLLAVAGKIRSHVHHSKTFEDFYENDFLCQFGCLLA